MLRNMKTYWIRWLGVAALAVLLPALWIVNCSGPRPAASDMRVVPPASTGAPYHVSVVVTNTGPGHGQINVNFTLRDTTTGQTYKQTQSVQLETGEQTVVGVDIQAPPGHYTPKVQLDYPPG